MSVAAHAIENMSRPLHNVDNYSPVSIISIVAKVFECVGNIQFGCVLPPPHDN